MIRVLFICHGNICRSPMAEFVMKELVRNAGKDTEIEVESAATSYEEIGNDIYPPAKKKLKEKGIPFEQRQARRMTREDYGRFDYLVGMDEENRANMRRICRGDPDGKISLLLDHTPQPRDVADPWYTGDFEATWNDIRSGCEALLAEICPS